MKRIHEKWDSRLGVILAVAGSAVGLGNFLRFPGLVAQYGGGAFMIAYFVSLLLIGIPVSWAEWTVGRLGGRFGFHSSPGIFHALTHRRWGKYVGTVGLLVPLFVVMYYIYVEAWCLGYAWHAVTGKLGVAGAAGAAGSEAFFSEFTGASANGSAVSGATGVFVLGTLGVNFFLLYRGISKGIEKACRYGMPLLVLLAVVMLVRVLTLGTPDAAHPERNISAALGFLWNPGDLASRLNNPQLWLAAAGQVFFSLTIGMGAIITYSSYLRKKDDVTLSSLAAVSTNEFCEVGLGGMTTVPAAFLFLGATGAAAGAAGGTFNLGFKVLPQVFAHMPAGMVFAAAFFSLLALAALTSSLSLLQPVLAFIEEAFHAPRRVSIACLGSVASLGTLWVWCFSKDLKALDTMDFWAGNVGVFVLGALIIVLFGWFVGAERAWRHMHQGALLRAPRVFKFIMRYVTPLYLGSIFFLFLLKEVLGWNFSFAKPEYAPTSYITDLFGADANTTARLTIAFMLVVSAVALALVAIGSRGWSRNRKLQAALRIHQAGETAKPEEK
jgi:SNF family Na+-dependent transporter